MRPLRCGSACCLARFSLALFPARLRPTSAQEMRECAQKSKPLRRVVSLASRVEVSSVSVHMRAREETEAGKKASLAQAICGVMSRQQTGSKHWANDDPIL